MKILYTSLLVLLSFYSFSQSRSNSFIKTVNQIKSQSKIDKNDKEALNLIDYFYNDALQSDKGELEANTINKLQAFMGSKDSKNKHLLMLFLMYQEHISETAARGLMPDSKFQVLAANTIEQEFNTLYGVTPAIIYIYKAEALSSDKKSQEAKEVVKRGLEDYPNSIPLKVYTYLDTKDESLKKDLVQNHARHWLVMQNKIE
jgi:hypothetical protein